MSKKTKAAKVKAARKPKPRRVARQRLGRRPNPLKATPSTPPGLLNDPIFLHHLAGAILRTLDFYPPSSLMAPEGIAGTDNDGSPEAQHSTNAKE